MRIRFSIRSFLLVVAVVAVLLSTVGAPALRQKQAVDKILAAGGTALYDKGAKIRSGSFMVHWLYSVNYVVLRPTKELPVETQLKWVTDLPQMESLSILPAQPRESGLTDPAAILIAERFSHLKLLKVQGATCSNTSLRLVRDELKETRGWIRRSNGWDLQLSSKKSAFYRLVEDFRLSGD